MTLTAAALNRSTLDRQHLLSRTPAPVADLVRSVCGLQAQHPASPYLAAAARLDGFDPADLDAAIRSADVIKASLMRLTLHLVHADDAASFRSAMVSSLRAAGLNDRRFRDTGLTVEDADRIIADAAAFASTPRSRAEIVEHLEERLEGPIPAGLWRALRFATPWRHGPDDLPWLFGDPARFVATATDEIDETAATARLVRSYLTAFGPARRADVSQFTMLRRPRIDAAIALLADEVVDVDGPGGPLVDLAEMEPADDDVEAPPRLLGMWDQTLLAYSDRSRMVDEKYRPMVIRRNGDTLAAVLVDGRVRGVWRRSGEGIEVTPFDRWSTSVWSALDVEAARLIALLDARDPAPYSSFDRWWADLPDDDRRVIGV